MGLGTKLLEKTVEKTATAVAGAALFGTAVASAAVVGGAMEAADRVSDKRRKSKDIKKKNAEQQKSLEEQKKQITKAKKELAAKEKQVAQAKKELEDQIAQVSAYTDYDVRLVCAKVAISSYIIASDGQVTEAEKNIINMTFTDISNRYGQEVYDRAYEAYKSCWGSFNNVLDYLRKVHPKDIKIYLQGADEVASLDGINEAEEKAIQRIKDYIEQQEAGFAQTLICPACSGLLSIDGYGYKAVCNSCGRETVIDPFNAPESAYREMNKQRNITIVENPAVPEEKPEVSEKKPASENKAGKEKAKPKAGKVALKVALGVMTGGVSLIPDAVNAAKKKDKK